MRDFQRLGLQQTTLDKLFGIFSRIDTTGQGVVDLEQFYRFFRLDRSPFADRVFSVLDTDGSGNIDFREFVLSIWNFCSMDLRALLSFSFTLFDTNGSGRIDREDMRTLIQEVYGKTLEKNERIARILQEAAGSEGGLITFEAFKDLNRQFPNLMFPAHSMQEALREQVLGRAFWEEQYKQRAALGGAAGAYSIWDVLQALDMGRSAEAKPELEEMKSARWKPDYLVPAEEGGYVPEVSEDPVAKAAMRRRELNAGQPRSNREAAMEKRWAGVDGAIDDDEDGTEGGGHPAGADTQRRSSISAGGAGGGGSIQRRGSVTAPERRNSTAGRRQSINGQAVRRSSISGDATAPAAQRKGSVTSGLANDRRQSLVGTSNTRMQLDNAQTMPNRQRRRSSLANAQERAAAFAMMHA